MLEVLEAIKFHAAKNGSEADPGDTLDDWLAGNPNRRGSDHDSQDEA